LFYASETFAIYEWSAFFPGKTEGSLRFSTFLRCIFPNLPRSPELADCPGNPGNDSGDGEMSGNPVLFGSRFRGADSAPIEATLIRKVGEDRWLAAIAPAGRIQPGDRLRFGETSESIACLLSFLDAEAISVNGEEALLAFVFHGPALEEALERLDHRRDRDAKNPGRGT